jgi:hypothetical protein
MLVATTADAVRGSMPPPEDDIGRSGTFGFSYTSGLPLRVSLFSATSYKAMIFRAYKEQHRPTLDRTGVQLLYVHGI